MKKRIITVLVLVSLIFSQSFALTLGDLILQNKTSPSINSIDGTRYFFGGGYELRFRKDTYAFKPWINGSPPQFHMGCNGVSISGGFLSLLGLNDIKNQLDNASTAFAWGLIMSIKASMPIVADVFNTIQAWARAIQKLLQNACKMGQALASRTPVAQSINHFFTEAASDKGFSTLKNTLNSWAQKVSNISDEVEKSADNNGPQNKVLTAKLLKHIKTVSLATFYFGKYLPSVNNNKKIAYFGDLKGLYSGNIGGLSLDISNYNQFERDVLLHKLAVLCFGEIGFSKNSYTKITSIINTDGTINTDKLKNSIYKALLGTFNDKNTVPVYIAPALDASNVYAFLYNGASSVKSDACDKTTEECHIPNYKLIYIYSHTQSTVDGKKVNNVFKVFSLFDYAGKNTKDSKITFKWKGFYQESLDEIRDAVKANSGITSYKFLGSAPESYTSYSFFLPGMGKYINILSLLAKKANGETPYIYYLEKLLAQRNANTAVFLMVNNLDSYIRTLLKDPDVDLSNTEKMELNTYLQTVDTIKADINKRILGSFKIDDSLRKMDEMFDEIYKHIKQQNLQNVGF